jgi:hypothetical protein
VLPVSLSVRSPGVGLAGIALAGISLLVATDLAGGSLAAPAWWPETVPQAARNTKGKVAATVSSER